MKLGLLLASTIKINQRPYDSCLFFIKSFAVLDINFQRSILGLMLFVFLFVHFEFWLAQAGLQSARRFPARSILAVSGITKALSLSNNALMAILHILSVSGDCDCTKAANVIGDQEFVNFIAKFGGRRVERSDRKTELIKCPCVQCALCILGCSSETDRDFIFSESFDNSDKSAHGRTCAKAAIRNMIIDGKHFQRRNRQKFSMSYLISFNDIIDRLVLILLIPGSPAKFDILRDLPCVHAVSRNLFFRGFKR